MGPPYRVATQRQVLQTREKRAVVGRERVAAQSQHGPEMAPLRLVATARRSSVDSQPCFFGSRAILEVSVATYRKERRRQFAFKTKSSRPTRPKRVRKSRHSIGKQSPGDGFYLRARAPADYERTLSRIWGNDTFHTRAPETPNPTHPLLGIQKCGRSMSFRKARSCVGDTCRRAASLSESPTPRRRPSAPRSSSALVIALLCPSHTHMCATANRLRRSAPVVLTRSRDSPLHREDGSRRNLESGACVCGGAMLGV